jgi:type IV pilus assembly protein PilM
MSWFKPNSFIGIDIGAGGVKMVELKKEKNRPVLFTYGFATQKHDVHELAKKAVSYSASDSVGKNAEKNVEQSESLTKDDAKIAKYASILKALCKAAKTKSKVAVVSVPVSSVFHTIVTLPVSRKEEFDRLLRSEVQKLLPYNLSQAALDYEVLPRKPEARTDRVLVNAVPRELVLFYSKIFQKAGLKLHSLEPESVALARSLVGRDSALAMLVDIGAERTNFFIIDEGKTITHNSIEIGGNNINNVLSDRLGLDSGLVDRVKQDIFESLMVNQEGILTKQGFLDIFISIIDPIIKEIQYSFDLYLRQSDNIEKRPEKIILTGGAGMFPFMAELIAEKFKLKCYIGDPWGRVVYQDSLKPLLRQIGPKMSVAIGLALRNIEVS